MIKTEIEPMLKKIALPNKITDKRDKRLVKSKDYGKKINLVLLNNALSNNSCFVSNYDKDLNPYQNYVSIEIRGTARFYSNGTVTTNINLPDESLTIFFEKFYEAYIMECLE